MPHTKKKNPDLDTFQKTKSYLLTWNPNTWT